MGNVEKRTGDLWVVYDDMDLELGRIKIHMGGSSGHHGIESIIKYLKTDKFYKFRIGVGRPVISNDGTCLYRENKDFLLSPFSKEEHVIIQKTIQKTAEAIRYALKEGIEKAMNRFN